MFYIVITLYCSKHIIIIVSQIVEELHAVVATIGEKCENGSFARLASVMIIAAGTKDFSAALTSSNLNSNIIKIVKSTI